MTPTLLRDRLLGAALPGAVPPDASTWERRHRVLLTVLLAHLPLIALAALLRGQDLLHSAVDVLPVAGAALLSTRAWLSRGARETLVAAGLVAAAAGVVHVGGGFIEAHFHFFVVLALLPLYQTWPPLALAVALVVLQHGVVGQVAPGWVFADGRADGQPWLWALVHGGGVLAAAAASALVVVVGERQRAELTAERDAARAAREEALHELAHRDPLTGVPNRRHLEARLRSVLAHQGAAVLLLDLDGFKRVNDTHGHEHGDVVLRRCATALADAVRPGDLLARLGGDEFVVVCPGLLDLVALQAAAARLSGAVREVAEGDGVGASVGTAVALPGEDAAQVLARADRAMYEVKGSRVPHAGQGVTLRLPEARRPDAGEQGRADGPPRSGCGAAPATAPGRGR